MESISTYMTRDHKECDHQFASVELAASRKEWEKAREGYDAFHNAMEHHFQMEEGVLFPAFEERTGNTQGPTSMMRMEHEQMRQLFRQMDQGIAAQDQNAALGACETLMILMQQHNAKEEQILYQMADQVLAPDAESLLRKMQTVSS